MVERYPEGMGKILSYLGRKFKLPVYITEHGAASSDEDFRERDLRDNLTALHTAIRNGVEVRGFFYWSLLDNFEWQFGYTKKFGLLAVDFADATLPRTPKPLAKVYTMICSTNSIRL
jgi:beta-glucosidase